MTPGIPPRIPPYGIITTADALAIATNMLEHSEAPPDRHLALCLIDWIMCATACGVETIDEAEFLQAWTEAMRGAATDEDFDVVCH